MATCINGYFYHTILSIVLWSGISFLDLISTSVPLPFNNGDSLGKCVAAFTASISSCTVGTVACSLFILPDYSLIKVSVMCCVIPNMNHCSDCALLIKIFISTLSFHNWRYMFMLFALALWSKKCW